MPYVLAALGGSLTERSGVIDLALEAKLLFGAFAAAAVGHATGSAALGIAGGMAAGAAVAAVASSAARCGCAADQVIVGIALNLRRARAARASCFQVIYHEGANSPPAPAFGDRVARRTRS